MKLYFAKSRKIYSFVEFFTTPSIKKIRILKFSIFYEALIFLMHQSDYHPL